MGNTWPSDMLTEACRVLDERLVRNPQDIDMGLIMGIGFPPWRGGLLRWADTVGVGKILETLKKYEAMGKRFEAPPALNAAAAKGKLLG